jgi:RimJ/RimL family protein N-acetyltransferase
MPSAKRPFLAISSDLSTYGSYLGMETLETRRLKLRQWSESDFINFARYYADEDNARYVGGKKDPDQAWRHMAALVYGNPPAGRNLSLVIGSSQSIREKATHLRHA